jgi:hypothetical protein
MPRARFRCLALATCWPVLMRASPASAEQASRAADVSVPSTDGEPGPAKAARVPSHDVILLAPPEPLERAVRAALSPWGMRTESVVRDAPPPTLPGAAQSAAALARELDAQALVWLSRNADGAALWIYDASKDTIVARPIPDTPLDRALAAALALSVKTWLRSPDQNPEAMSPRLESPVVPAPAAPLARAAPPAVNPGRDGAPPRRDAARWQVVVHAAARRGAFEQTVFEPRYGLELRVSPWQSVGATRWLLAARVEMGSAQSIDNSTFQGVYSELGGGVSLGVAHRVAEPLGVAFHIGATLHRGSVWGTLLLDRRAVERAEWGAAAQLRPEAELSFGPVGFIFQPTVGVSIVGERYQADGEVPLETRPVWWMLGGALRAELF